MKPVQLRTVTYIVRCSGILGGYIQMFNNDLLFCQNCSLHGKCWNYEVHCGGPLFLLSTDNYNIVGCFICQNIFNHFFAICVNRFINYITTFGPTDIDFVIKVFFLRVANLCLLPCQSLQ